MKFVKAIIEVELEITTGEVREVCKDLAEKFDGYQPPGGNLDYQVTETRPVRAETLAD